MGEMFIQLMPLFLIFAIFYFLLIRPQQKRAKQHKEMVAAIQRGDKILRVHAETPVNLSTDQEKILNQFNETLTKKNSTMTEGFFDKVKKMFN